MKEVEEGERSRGKEKKMEEVERAAGKSERKKPERGVKKYREIWKKKFKRWEKERDVEEGRGREIVGERGGEKRKMCRWKRE